MSDNQFRVSVVGDDATTGKVKSWVDGEELLGEIIAWDYYSDTELRAALSAASHQQGVLVAIQPKNLKYDGWSRQLKSLQEVVKRDELNAQVLIISQPTNLGATQESFGSYGDRIKIEQDLRDQPEKILNQYLMMHQHNTFDEFVRMHWARFFQRFAGAAYQQSDLYNTPTDNSAGVYFSFIDHVTDHMFEWLMDQTQKVNEKFQTASCRGCLEFVLNALRALTRNASIRYSATNASGWPQTPISCNSGEFKSILFFLLYFSGEKEFLPRNFGSFLSLHLDSLANPSTIVERKESDHKGVQIRIRKVNSKTDPLKELQSEGEKILRVMCRDGAPWAIFSELDIENNPNYHVQFFFERDELK